ncbi:MAG TPA: VOC family protein, partial [Gaiellaceae bacterium]|nr:VOC family protein [Gaiellaceae bacterium]
MTQRIVPFIGYEDAARAIEWLERAFGFTEKREARHEEGGTITHAELDLAGATIYLSRPQGYASPLHIRETSELARRAYDNPWVIDGHFVEIEDVDAHYERAVAAEATIL